MGQIQTNTDQSDPANYPLEPPIAYFTQPMFHPNVFTNGQVCLSILKAQREWAASITIPQILIGLQELLATVRYSARNI
jgi:ubiquitin-protein ligase